MAEIATAPVTTAGVRPNYIDWSAVIAGAVAAAAISFVLLSFGAAIGLSVASPWANLAVSAKWLATVAAFWAVALQIGSYLAGGYVAGRMRARWGEAVQHESDLRDGLHGLLVWSLGVVVSAGLVLAAAGALARSPSAARALEQGSEPIAYYADTLLRGAPQAQGAQVAERRVEVRRILSAALAKGSLDDADRRYLVQLAQQSGGQPADADARVNATYAALNQSVREAADKARKTGIASGLVTAVSLLLGLAAAWYGAQRGGHHRDHAVEARLFVSPRVRPRPSSGTGAS